MADGKWIPELTATTPVVEAAQRALEARLQVVAEYLPRALAAWQDDPEYVHQLRVGTRRAAAALQLFADCLPRRACKTARKQLRRLRRAAGQARDWDVFRLHLLERMAEATAAAQPGLDWLLGYAWAQRLSAQQQLEAAAEKHAAAAEAEFARLVAAVRKPRGKSGPRTLRDLADTVLERHLADLENAARKDLNDLSNLHQVRIAGKRLRYALELLANCFDPSFRDTTYPAVETMQEILGRANDCHQAAQHLTNLAMELRRLLPAAWDRLAPGIEGLLAEQAQRLTHEQQRFLDWWADWHKTGGPAALRGLLLNLTGVTSPGR